MEFKVLRAVIGVKKKNRILGVFITVIFLIFTYGLLHDYLYDYRVSISEGINIPKETIKDISFPQYDIANRAIGHHEEKMKYYEAKFLSANLGNNFSDENAIMKNWYLMIEKPDAQFMEVELNGELIGTYGELSGRANLWNNTFYIQFSENILQEENVLVITMYSEYMTGLAGRLMVLNHNDYRTLSIITSVSNSMIEGAIIIAVFASIILLMVTFAWKDQLYNIKTFVFFLISILALGFSLLDHQELPYLLTSYLTFKKAVVLSYHVAITFAGFGIASMLNLKYRYNIGLIGLSIMLVQSLLINDMIYYRESYAVINYFTVAGTFQMILFLFIYRKRARVGASVLIIGFSLAAATVLKLVFITSNIIGGSMLIDLPILIVIYVTIVLFLLYLEMIQVVAESDTLEVEDINHLGITNYMQGSFTIDRSLSVVGAYSTACDHIFDRLIIGCKISELYEVEDEDVIFLKETLEMIFDPKFPFKDGFLALLPETLERDGRLYQINYSIVERSSILLRITLSDITRSIELEAQMSEERKTYLFVINALKARQEVGYFIERTALFLDRIKDHGFTPYHQAELHTLKGNLGQFGFFKFEQSVHTVEDALQEDFYDTELLIDTLRRGFQESVAILEDFIGLEFFSDGYGQLSLSKEEALELEDAYQKSLIDKSQTPYFEELLRHVRYLNLKGMFNRYNEYIIRLSQDTEKNILPFEIRGNDVKVSPEKAENLLRVLVAIFRNAVVHGIETPVRRMELSKDSFGTIGCELVLKNDTIHLCIRDDGAGIDIDFIIAKALQYGIITKTQEGNMSEEEKLNLIFESGMSQLEDVDILAGRGIGLYSVKELVEGLGGSVKVSSVLDEGTTFDLNLPIAALRD